MLDEQRLEQAQSTLHALHELGFEQLEEGQNERAAATFKEAVELCGALPPAARSDLEPTLCTARGAALCLAGDARAALACHVRALKLAKAARDLAAQGGCLNNLGISYAALGDAARAAQFYELAADIAAAEGTKGGRRREREGRS